MVTKFLEHGTVLNLNKEFSGRRREVRSELNINRIREFFQRHNTSSLRKASQELMIPKSSVQVIMNKDIHFFPYKSHHCDELSQFSKERRRNFANIAQQNLINRLDQIWFTDESWICLSDFTNKQNDRTWAPKLNHPHTRVRVKKFPQKVMVWAAINAVHGVIFFVMPQGNVTSEVYIRMLTQSFIPRLQELGIMNEVIFMQDGARPHTAAASMNFLIDNFENRLISHR